MVKLGSFSLIVPRPTEDAPLPFMEFILGAEHADLSKALLKRMLQQVYFAFS